MKKIQIILCVGFFIFFAGKGVSRGNDWTLPPWGLNLEELNRAVKVKAVQIKEDKDRIVIELQYAPAKSLKVRRGKVVALLSFSDSSTLGSPYGYAFEGKIFGRVVFFKDHPELSPEMVIRNLKEKYPQGKVLRSFSTTLSLPFFEYKSDPLYVFSTEKGVFYYEPLILEKVIRIEQGQLEQEDKRYDQKIRDKGEKPKGPEEF